MKVWDRLKLTAHESAFRPTSVVRHVTDRATWPCPLSNGLAYTSEKNLNS